MKDFGEQLLRYISDKETIVKELMHILGEQQTISNGLSSFTEAIDDGKVTNKQLGQMIKVLCRGQKSQADAIRNLTMANLIYISGGDFSGDCAIIASKLGKGQEALRAIYKEKFQ